VRVLALVPYRVGIAPGQRYRLEQWAPYLAEEGIELVFVPFASARLNQLLYERGHYAAKAWEMARGLMRRVADAWRAADYDAVIVHREASLIGPAWAERLAQKRCPALVYDFDDAVYESYVSPTNRYLSYLKMPGKTAAICKAAAAITAGNALLADYARRHNPNVTVVPSTIDMRSYQPRPERPRTRPVVGWMGSHSSAQYLAVVAGALRRLRERLDFRMLVVGAHQVPLSGLDLECRGWTSAREVEDLWEMDIGLMPLPDEPWARGKCGMKALQYMGVGMPPIVSPVGVNAEIVRHEENGLLARTEDEWVDAMERLLRDEALRSRLGHAARRTVEQHYSAQVHAPVVARLLRSVAKRAR
jgi:glycosyltransferase involved in cell wall biosynthesis